jgi:hypothetical protein
VDSAPAVVVVQVPEQAVPVVNVTVDVPEQPAPVVNVNVEEQPMDAHVVFKRNPGRHAQAATIKEAA